MSEQPEALRLADELAIKATLELRWEAALELRWLHKENERLREALKTYGQHRSDCAVVLGGYQCTCGFNQSEQLR